MKRPELSAGSAVKEERMASPSPAPLGFVVIQFGVAGDLPD